MTPEDVAYLMGLMRRLKTGRKEKLTEKKAASNRRNAEIALAVRQGRSHDADALRWKYYPERMRAKALAAQLGTPVKKTL